MQPLGRCALFMAVCLLTLPETLRVRVAELCNKDRQITMVVSPAPAGGPLVHLATRSIHGFSGKITSAASVADVIAEEDIIGHTDHQSLDLVYAGVALMPINRGSCSPTVGRHPEVTKSDPQAYEKIMMARPKPRTLDEPACAGDYIAARMDPELKGVQYAS